MLSVYSIGSFLQTKQLKKKMFKTFQLHAKDGTTTANSFVYLKLKGLNIEIITRSLYYIYKLIHLCRKLLL